MRPEEFRFIYRKKDGSLLEGSWRTEALKTDGYSTWGFPAYAVAIVGVETRPQRDRRKADRRQNNG